MTPSLVASRRASESVRTVRYVFNIVVRPKTDTCYPYRCIFRTTDEQNTKIKFQISIDYSTVVDRMIDHGWTMSPSCKESTRSTGIQCHYHHLVQSLIFNLLL